MTDSELRQQIEAIEPWVIDVRRKLHRIPEHGFAEYKTQQLITDVLRELYIPYTTKRTWVIGLIEGAHPGPTVALRADIDALPVTEPESDCSSQHPGFMHACGHDAHTAILLGAARTLMGMKDTLHGNIKLLFQPAEETDGGAQPMIEDGALQNPDVSMVYGLHVQPNLPTGTVETRAGTLNASTDTLHITVNGTSGHGAYPEEGADAILAAAQVITSLHTITSRNVSPLESAVITIGEISGGVANNVLCDKVTLCGTMRAATPDVRARLHTRAKEAAIGAAAAMGCTADVHVEAGYSPLVNHADASQRVLNIAARLFGSDSVLEKKAPSMGGEDFSYYVEAVPGAFYHIGCTAPGAPEYGPLHSPLFRLDEGCLRIGVLMQTALALDALERP